MFELLEEMVAWGGTNGKFNEQFQILPLELKVKFIWVLSYVFLTVLDLPAQFMSVTLHVDKSLKMAARFGHYLPWWARSLHNPDFRFPISGFWYTVSLWSMNQVCWWNPANYREQHSFWMMILEQIGRTKEGVLRWVPFLCGRIFLWSTHVHGNMSANTRANLDWHGMVWMIDMTNKDSKTKNYKIYYFQR